MRKMIYTEKPKILTDHSSLVFTNIERAVMKNSRDFGALKDLYDFSKCVAKEELDNDTHLLRDHILFMRRYLTDIMHEQKNVNSVIEAGELLKKSYHFTSRDFFTDYMTYLEWDRPPKERFWQPRARILTPLANAIQALTDDELDELFLSMPPRIGKTTMILFLVSWIIGKHPEWSNLYSAFSDIITKAFYNGILEVINDPTTYLWSDIFPGLAIARTNAQDETLDIERKKRYPSITCRSLYGTLNGACDCRGMLISDDLIGGIEEALNKDRLASAWSKVDNNLIPRAKEGCKLLWVGTRWSIADPAGTRMNIIQNDVRFKDHRYKIINVPALNEHGESNFDYDFGVGFSTKYYMMRKASFIKNNDEASWLAQYMGEPVERAGTLFERADMRYFNGDLPDEKSHIRTFAACDPAFGGGDFCAMAICCQYEEGTFVVDVLYSNADKNFTQPTIANKLMEWNVGSVQFECNASTVSFKEGVEKILKEKNFKCNVTYKAAPNQQAKEVRIYEKAPEIRDLYFLEGSYRSREYEQFMTNVFSFQISGKNKHDDAPDCLAMCVEVQNYNGISFKVRKRVF